MRQQIFQDPLRQYHGPAPAHQRHRHPHCDVVRAKDLALHPLLPEKVLEILQRGVLQGEELREVALEVERPVPVRKIAHHGLGDLAWRVRDLEERE